MPRVIRTVLIGGVAMLLAGCGGIPSSGPVQQLRDPVDVRDRPPVQSDAVPPEDGATQVQIVEGFLDAMGSYETGPDGSYPTAAKFLTDAAAGEWQPHPERQAITVYGARPGVVADEDGVVLSVSAQASYDRTDGFQRAPSTLEYELDLAEDDNGEWRIENPPTGIVISADDFASQFDPYNLYYFDRTFEQLVPDPIFLPRTADGSVATLLVRELLRGPSDWLALAVDTAFPSGTELDPASVTQPSAGGETVIGLSREAATKDDGSQTTPDERARMVEQLAWTLGQLPAVSEFSVTTKAVPLTPDVASVFQNDEPEGSASQRALYGVTDAGVVVIEDDTPTPVPGPLASYPDLVEVAVNHDVTQAVALDANGGLVWSPLADDNLRESVPEGRKLSSLAWDVRGLVWALGRGPAPDPAEGAEGGVEDDENGENDGNDEAGIFVVNPDSGVVADVAVSGPAEGPVERFALSPDGTRIAAVIAGELHLGVIVRSEDAVDVQGLRLAKVVDDQVVDVAWNGAEELVVLTQEAGDGDAAGPAEVDAGLPGEDGEVAELAPSDVHVVDLGTLSAAVPRAVDHAESITAKFDGLRAVDTPPDGIQVMTENQSWTDIAGVRSPAYPG